MSTLCSGADSGFREGGGGGGGYNNYIHKRGCVREGRARPVTARGLGEITSSPNRAWGLAPAAFLTIAFI